MASSSHVMWPESGTSQERYSGVAAGVAVVAALLLSLARTSPVSALEPM